MYLVQLGFVFRLQKGFPPPTVSASSLIANSGTLSCTGRHFTGKVAVDDIFAPSLNSPCHLSFIGAHVVAFKLNEVLRDFLNQYTPRVLSCLQSHHYKTKNIFILMATKLVLPENTRGWSQQAHA